MKSSPFRVTEDDVIIVTEYVSKYVNMVLNVLRNHEAY